MKRLLITALALIICFSFADARRKKAKAGQVKDNTYVDASYGFSFKLSDNWKYSRGDANSPHRLYLTQNNWETPSYYLDNSDYTQIPKVVVYADTSTFGVFAFLDSLLSDSYDSDQKKELMKEFDILLNDPERDELVQRGRRTIKIAEERGVWFTGYVPYTKEVASSASSLGGKRVKEAYGGTIAGVKMGKTIVLFHMICEWMYYERVDAQLKQMVLTLAFESADEKP